MQAIPHHAFVYHVTVRESDIDQLGHVNNIIYLRWVQEAAIAHWEAIATEEMKKNLLWVIARHEIDYLSPAYLETKIIAYTWVAREYEGARSDRYVYLCEEGTGKLLAKVKTTWFLLDAAARRPKRITEDIMQLFL